MGTPGNEWYWAFQCLQEFRMPLEKFAGFDACTRIGYMAALSLIWDARRERERQRNK